MIQKYGKGSVSNRYGNHHTGWKNLSEEEYKRRCAEISKNSKKWHDSLSPEEKKEYARKRKDWWENLSELEKSKHLEKVFKSQQYSSNLEKYFAEHVLDFLGLKHKPQCFISGKAFDFILKGTKILIEVNYFINNGKISQSKNHEIAACVCHIGYELLESFKIGAIINDDQRN